MALLDFFLSRKKNTANIAKERLQIIVAERRRGDAEPHYLPQLRKDILEVICKYVQIDPEMVSVQLEQRDGDISILELNVTLPETEESKSSPVALSRKKTVFATRRRLFTGLNHAAN